MVKLKPLIVVLGLLALQGCSTINIIWKNCHREEIYPDGNRRYRCEKLVGDYCHLVDVITDKDIQILDTIPLKGPCPKDVSALSER